ncbi:MAG: MBL fold metallo-hydrolase [Calditrichaeota bacterium]|nr:MBL fold metallo-hydrolase [Calditrichota bacterium]
MSNALRLHFLGTGSIIPHPDRSCSSILLETPKERILIDIGAGTLRRMATEQIDIHSITYIFITHFHPDHVGDLIPFLFALRNSREEERMLRIWGPRGFLNFIRGLESAYGRWVQNPMENIKYYELKRRLLDFPGFRLIWNRVIHKNESVGFRFEIGGKVIAFSGDSGYCTELIRLSRDADIAVLECSHADEYAVEGHLSPSLAAKIAEEAGVKQLVLTHFYPDALESDLESVARKYFSGEIHLAYDGFQIELPLEASPVNTTEDSGGTGT